MGYQEFRIVYCAVIIKVKFVHDLADFNLCSFNIPIEELSIAFN